MRWRQTFIDGTYGDKTVILTAGIVDTPQKAVLLFHGVHSNACSDPGNKYARIGRALAECGVLPVMAETSRRVRNRHDYANDPMGWIYDAFDGKTYMQELEDTYAAYKAVRQLYPALSLTLWGFSLGGLSALLIAGGFMTGDAPQDIEGLIMCGSGDETYPENADVLKLPILNTVREPFELYRAAEKVRAPWVRSFRGSEDATFSEAACRRIFDKIAASDKAYCEIDGSDHSFRLVHGAPSRRPLKELYARLPQLFPEHVK
ncbi:MAG: alpha/beta hydrolase [Pyramidobacter sp.]|nr:alpha/beta hydrolase [Pyramidobacter sp.]